MSSGTYDKLSEERKKLQADGEMPEFWSTGGWQLFKNKYLYQADTPRQQYTRIAKTLAAHTPDPEVWGKKFFDLMWKGWLSPSTPILANTGTARGLPVSCAGSYIGDSINDIYEAKRETAMLTKMGFGTAGYLGDIRCRGTPISTGGTSTGVLPVIEGFQKDMEYVAQGTARRGSWAGYLPIDHGDFDEVCTYLEQQPDGNNIGWCISNDFVEKLEKREPEALRRYAKALKTKLVSGKGYYFFHDKANAKRPKWYVDQNLDIKASQLCSEIILHSSSEYTYTCQPSFAPIIKKGVGLTDLGEVCIGDEIWSKEGWTKVVNKVSSGIKPVNSYDTRKGSFIGTEDHRVVQDGEKLEVREAEAIDSCPVFSTPTNNPLDWESVLSGLLLGDGTQHNDHPTLCIGEKDGDYYKYPISEYITTVGSGYLRRVNFTPDFDLSVRVHERDFDHKKWAGNERSFLLGLYSANGSIVKQQYDNGYHVILTQTSKNIAMKAMWMLQTLGMTPKLYKTEGKLVEWDNGTYLGRTRYDVRLTTNGDIIKFRDTIGFLQDYKQKALNEVYTVTSKPKVVSNTINEVNYLGDFEVFHIEVDNPTHTYWTGGLDVSNCVLASMNLVHWDEFKDTDAIFEATVFLDCVCQEFIERAKNIKGLEKAVAATKKGRALGLGVCGFGSYLQSKMIPFESLEAHMWNTEVFSTMQKESIRASEWIASVYGEPEWLIGYGRANSHCLAVAPTKSTALIMGGVSEGINPDTAMVYTQRSAGGEIDRVNPYLLKLMKEKGVYTQKHVEEVRDAMGSVQGVSWLSDEEKAVFKTAFEIDQHVILRLASTRGNYLDQWASLNLFFAAGEKESYVNSVHKQAFLDPNILALYYVYSMAGIQASNDRNECTACQ